MKKALLYQKVKNKFVKCTACKQFCLIGDGNTGICGVRQNISGDLYLLVYGKAVAANIDPIEKKPLFHFLPGTKVFSIGTIGCNFGCSFCQNWDISQAAKEFKKKLSKEKRLKDLKLEVTRYGYDLPPEAIVSFCEEKKIPSIAYTYNEPAIFFEYTYDTAILASKAGIRNVYVSNGYASHDAIDKITPYLDAINIDLKSFSDDFYKKTCKARLQPVLDNIKYYHKKGVWVEVTTLVIPGENDSKKELTQIAEFILSVSPSIPWHVSSFSPAYKMKDKMTTSEKKIREAYKIGKEVGLKYVYGGNIWGEDLQSTYCPACNNTLIKRDWGFSKLQTLKRGVCDRCAGRIDGVWA
ncbi:AmmeMemoRadiSam system radical SAM enzyme [Candidatus Dojkabacteria bacterium]|nr:AmmeMemoRadiSam system radical SAM enzyme [Candidatus Dojkabacteria bacterium]